jgi:hypothetical protein
MAPTTAVFGAEASVGEGVGSSGNVMVGSFFAGGVLKMELVVLGTSLFDVIGDEGEGDGRMVVLVSCVVVLGFVVG